MGKIEVKQNRLGNILYIFGAIIMSFLSFLLSLVHFSSLIGLLMKFIMIFGVLFFGYCAYFLIKRSLAHQPILIVDKKGITDYSSAIAVGFIPWEDVMQIDIDGVLGNEFIEIKLKNEDKYIQSMNKIQRIFMKVNLKMRHAAVCITLNSTGISPYEIYDDIQKRFQDYKSSHYEESCGAIVYTIKDYQLYYVIVQSKNEHYGFPKGHKEIGETKIQTALREIKEETGLDVYIENEYTYEDEYYLQDQITIKHVTYFLASYENQEISFDENEVICTQLLNFEEAMRTLTYENTKNILREVHHRLQEKL